MDTDQVNVVTSASRTTSGMGLSIRGLAGPFAILGQNFAPGTSTADIESAMTPVGGEMTSCKIVKTQPFLIVEMVFVSREGGERVIETFNNKTVRLSQRCILHLQSATILISYRQFLIVHPGRWKGPQNLPQDWRLSILRLRPEQRPTTQRSQWT